MRSLDPPATAIREVVSRALDEDLGTLGDITTLGLISEGTLGSGCFVSRASGVIAGTAAVTEVYTQVGADVGVEWHAYDGQEVTRGQVLGRVGGPLLSIFTAERAALNLFCHLSGIADLTRRFVRATHGGRARIRDTRKTLPGLRSLEKAAVRAGGGFNHRDCLSDAVLIKDNHLRVLGIVEAVERSRARWPGRSIGVECDTLEQLERVLPVKPDLILLDNMTPEEATRAVDMVAGRVPLELSGGVDISNIADYAATGVDFIAVGAITHSAGAFDIGFDLD